jgi:hypothetical protein
MKLELSRHTFENTFVKIGPVGAELPRVDERTDGQTGMTKLIVAFRNFANTPITVG